MAEPSDAYRYMSYLRSRWRFIAVSCVAAGALALVVSLATPPKYAATCQVLVEPPAGADLRGALAVSPIYLESLKTYEYFAASNSLFQRALDRFHLRRRFHDTPIESLKSRILKVSMLPYTRILQIQVTLPDPEMAHALALYLGEETVKLNRTVNSESDQDLLQDLDQQETQARERLQESDAAWTRMLARQPLDGLRRELRSSGELRSALQRELLAAEQDASDPRQSDAAARLTTLRKQLAQVGQAMAAKERLLAQRVAERDRLDTERTASQTAYNAVEARLRQVRGDVGARGERLRIIDPGIVPEQPSSPNIPLVLVAALLLGLVAPVIYLTLALSYQTQRSSVRRSSLRMAGAGSDE
jgi:uncharacterized protein involved in exopolysaccharide biosynthesis